MTCRIVVHVVIVGLTYNLVIILPSIYDTYIYIFYCCTSSYQVHTRTLASRDSTKVTQLLF